MAVTAGTLGLARRNILKAYNVYDDVEKQFEWLVHEMDKTTQGFEQYKQLANLSAAVQTGDGATVAFDDPFPIFTMSATPVLYTKGVKFSYLTEFTNQYKSVLNMQKQFAFSFTTKRNQTAADLYNTGFSATNKGVNSEKLFLTTHSMGGYTFANTPTTANAFGPAGVKAGIIGIRKQKTARNEPMPYTGPIRLIVPPDLEGEAIEVVKSLQLANVADNNTNEFIRNRVNLKVCDYLTSTTAYFMLAEKPMIGGIRILDQAPYDINQLELTEALMYPWVASQSWTNFWFDAHESWGDAGA